MLQCKRTTAGRWHSRGSRWAAAALCTWRRRSGRPSSRRPPRPANVCAFKDNSEQGFQGSDGQVVTVAAVCPRPARVCAFRGSCPQPAMSHAMQCRSIRHRQAMCMAALLPGLQHTKAASTGHKECQVGGTAALPPLERPPCSHASIGRCQPPSHAQKPAQQLTLSMPRTSPRISAARNSMQPPHTNSVRSCTPGIARDLYRGAPTDSTCEWLRSSKSRHAARAPQ